MKFVIVTGMSGAGKSTAMKMMEDMGYFCIDSNNSLSYCNEKAVSENLSIQPLSFIPPYYYPKFCSLSKNQPHSYVSFLPAAK